MRKLLLFIALLPLLAMQAQMPEMQADEAVRTGKLKNGLTYYIRHNELPKDRANFYIAQRVGSVQEEESQRGLAHFLEHMCFNGTTNFPGNAITEYLQSIGINFGGELNAYTGTDETVYNIDNVPVTPGHIDSCLLILHDWSHDVLLEADEIDKERGVIHEEWRLRNSGM
ncbi:MAG: insulinase family protein, partial [Bacteroidaceae bacterium]|nr:insulinase family protein [Bacteroidaceae bacterium]